MYGFPLSFHVCFCNGLLHTYRNRGIIPCIERASPSSQSVSRGRALILWPWLGPLSGGTSVSKPRPSFHSAGPGRPLCWQAPARLSYSRHHRAFSRSAPSEPWVTPARRSEFGSSRVFSRRALAGLSYGGPPPIAQSVGAQAAGT